VAAERPTLGILAGGGRLPGTVAAAAHAAGRAVFLIGLEGFADPAVLAPWPHEVVRMLAAGRILAALRAHGCRDLVLVGPVRRPSLLDLRPDAEGARILGRIGRAAFAGDDGLLAAVVRVFAEEGFRVLGLHEVLSEALGPAGLLSRAAPDAVAMADIRRGVAVARALGAIDVGQGCVVQQGIVLAVEAAEGTDAMLQRVAALREAGRIRLPRGVGVLVKAPKQRQDRRFDLPSIGPDTVLHAAQAGLAGIAIVAGGTILAEPQRLVEAADANGLFVLGRAECEAG
jgi:UDP-2,3-diacylglucosamine hydrolase